MMTSGIKDAMMDKIGNLFSLPDQVEDPHLRKLARAAFGVALIALAFVAFYFMNGGSFLAPSWKPIIASLADPGMMTMISIAGGSLVSAFGLTIIIKNLFGKEHSQTVAKVASIAVPLALLAAGALFLGAGFQHGFAPPSVGNNYVVLGAVTLPCGIFLSLWNMCSVLKQKSTHVGRAENFKEVDQLLEQATAQSKARVRKAKKRSQRGKIL
jgi:hypothetical protein